MYMYMYVLILHTCTHVYTGSCYHNIICNLVTFVDTIATSCSLNVYTVLCIY